MKKYIYMYVYFSLNFPVFLHSYFVEQKFFSYAISHYFAKGALQNVTALKAVTCAATYHDFSYLSGSWSNRRIFH